MNFSEVNEILKVFHSKDWSKYYDFHNELWKKNTWFHIGNLEEFSFVKKIINRDLMELSTEYFVSDWITFLIYEKNDFFGLHTDDKVDYGISEKKIIYSGGYVLNSDFEGGNFLVDNKKIQTSIGELFYFARNQPHEVTKVTSGFRYSLHFAIETLRKKSII